MCRLCLSVVIVFAAIMSLILIGMVLNHNHRESKARSERASKSFFSGGPSRYAEPIKAPFKSLNKRLHRKSRISGPITDVESSPNGVRRPFDQESASVDLLTWANPPPRLRPRDLDDDASSQKSGQQGNRMTLADALKQDRAQPASKKLAHTPAATREMF